MRQQRVPRMRRGLAVLVPVALIALVAAGCDSRVDVRGPRFNLPTVPTIPTTPSGATVSETRAIAGVSGVALDAVGLVEIQLGATESLTITAPESVMPLLTSDVAGGLLILDRASASYEGQASDIRYDLVLRQLDRLLHRGVGEMDARGLDTQRLDIQMSGVGNVRAAGRADVQEVRINGLGEYLAPGLQSRVARLDISSGDAVIWATERIEGRVAFGCTVEYRGNPIVDVTGGGVVRKLGFDS